MALLISFTGIGVWYLTPKRSNHRLVYNTGKVLAFFPFLITLTMIGSGHATPDKALASLIASIAVVVLLNNRQKRASMKLNNNP